MRVCGFSATITRRCWSRPRRSLPATQIRKSWLCRRTATKPNSNHSQLRLIEHLLVCRLADRTLLVDGLDRSDRQGHGRGGASLVQSIRARAHRWRLTPGYLHSLPQVVAEPGFSGGLQFVSHGRVLLGQYVVAAGPPNAALDG